MRFYWVIIGLDIIRFNLISQHVNIRAWNSLPTGYFVGVILFTYCDTVSPAFRPFESLLNFLLIN